MLTTNSNKRGAVIVRNGEFQTLQTPPGTTDLGAPALTTPTATWLGVAAAISGAAQSDRQQITIDAPRLKTVTFSPGFKVGKLLFVSGQVSIDPDGNIVGRGDFEAQCKQVFHNIQLVLDKAGASFSDIVKTNAYMTDVRNYSTYAKIRGEYFSGQYPASTVIGNAALIHEGLLLEVDAIAVLK